MYTSCICMYSCLAICNIHKMQVYTMYMYKRTSWWGPRIEYCGPQSCWQSVPVSDGRWRRIHYCSDLYMYQLPMPWHLHNDTHITLVCMYMYMICIHTAQYTGSVWSDKCFIYMTLLNWNMHTHGHNHQPFILHNLICLSSAADTSSGRVGWKDTQLTPRSWPWQGRNTYICTRWNNIHIVNLNLQYTYVHLTCRACSMPY